ncbi:hypothetical protein BGZ83_000627 [Gryganskiella cystojenkinii]|nr:hypothetical protein BGZ83_000627 [Gryganskiella cystojenkinii]
MRFQSLILLATVATVALARVDTTETCSGAQVCDVGYCCSTHILDKQDMPHVITYDELSQTTYASLAKSLESEGSHVSAEEAKAHTTIASILQQGVAEKEKMLALKPKNPVAASPPPALESTKDTSETTTPIKTNQASKVGASAAALVLATAASLFL